MEEAYYIEEIQKLSKEIHANAIEMQKKGRKLSICFGESFTAGLICSTLAENPGASAYILGGIIFYHPQIKKSICISSDIVENNIISSSCSREAALMTLRQFQSWGTDPDIALSSIGLAEPAIRGGGKVFISICTKAGKIIDREFTLDPGNFNERESRNKIRRYAVMKALEMIFEHIEFV